MNRSRFFTTSICLAAFFLMNGFCPPSAAEAGGTAAVRNANDGSHALLGDITAIAAGGFHTCALTTGGGVKCWGPVGVNGIPKGETEKIASNVAEDVPGLGSGITAITAGRNHTCALTAGGGVKCWGANGFGELGNGPHEGSRWPVEVTGLSSGVKAIAAGGDHTCALTSQGGVKCWGENQSGELGVSRSVSHNTPVDVVGMESGVAAIAAGDIHNCTLTTGGGVKCWGANSDGRLGDGTTEDSYQPVDVVGLESGVTAIAAGFSTMCAVTTAGGLKCWGMETVGLPGNPIPGIHNIPTDVPGLENGILAVAMNYGTICVLGKSGGVKCWGRNPYQKTIETPMDIKGLTSGVAAIASGDRHTCAVTKDGGVKCWGDNTYDQLGNGTTGDTRELTPVDVRGFAEPVSGIVLGVAHTCVIAKDGNVQCVGANWSGQLGDGTTEEHTMPVKAVGLGSGVRQVTAGYDFTCALTAYWAVKCWGENENGQLGDGSLADQHIPVDVDRMSHGIWSIAAGASHACALTDQGEVECWGDNYQGQLGDGTTISASHPLKIKELASGVQAITAGMRHTCALMPARGVKCWGGNDYGQLGDGTNIQRATPVDVAGLQEPVTAIAAGPDFTCALTSSGGVKCWGANRDGELGDGTFTSRSLPVDVTGLAGSVNAIAAGYSHACALTADGGVECWGRNADGQLGDGTIENRNTAVEVFGLTSGIVKIAAGGAHTCAITKNGGVKCWGSIDYGRDDMSMGEPTGVLDGPIQPIPSVLLIATGILAVVIVFLGVLLFLWRRKAPTSGAKPAKVAS